MPGEKPSFPDREFADQSKEWDKEALELQAKIRERLHDVDDLLKDSPTPLPERETIRGLVSAAARLTDLPPVEAKDQIESREHVLGDMQDKLSRGLEPLGLELNPHDPDQRPFEYDWKKNPITPEDPLYNDPRFDNLPHVPPKK